MFGVSVVYTTTIITNAIIIFIISITIIITSILTSLLLRHLTSIDGEMRTLGAARVCDGELRVEHFGRGRYRGRSFADSTRLMPRGQSLTPRKAGRSSSSYCTIHPTPSRTPSLSSLKHTKHTPPHAPFPSLFSRCHRHLRHDYHHHHYRHL